MSPNKKLPLKHHQCIKSPDANFIDLDDEMLLASNVEEESGIMGFFKKTLSSVKKTFENTFNKPPSRNNNRS